MSQSEDFLDDHVAREEYEEIPKDADSPMAATMSDPEATLAASQTILEFPSLELDIEPEQQLQQPELATIHNPSIDSAATASLPLSQLYPTHDEDFLAPTNPAAFRQSQYLEQQKERGVNTIQQVVMKRTNEMRGDEKEEEQSAQKKQKVSTTNLNFHPAQQQSQQRPLVPAAAASTSLPRPSPPPPLPHRSSPGIAIAPRSAAAAPPLDATDAMSRFLEDDDMIDSEEFDKLMTKQQVGQQQVNPSAATAAPKSAPIVLPQPKSASLTLPKRPLLVASTKALAQPIQSPPQQRAYAGVENNVPRTHQMTVAGQQSIAKAEQASPQRPQQHQHNSAFQPTQPSRQSFRPVVEQPQQQQLQHQSFPSAVSNALPQSNTVAAQPISPQQLRAQPTISHQSPVVPSSVRAVHTPAPKLEHPPSVSSPSPYPPSRRTPTPSSLYAPSGSTYTTVINNSIVERTFPGPIGRLKRRGVKMEDGNSSGRGTPQVKIQGGTGRAQTVDLTHDGTTTSSVQPDFSPDDDDDDSASGLHDPDFQLAAWQTMLWDNQILMPSQEDVSHECTWKYAPIQDGSEPKSCVPPPSPWFMNLHFLSSPHVILRSKIPRAFVMIVSYQLVGLDARVLLKDPFGMIFASVSHDALLQHVDMLAAHNVLEIRNTVVYHSSPAPQHRTLILTKENVWRVWRQEEEHAKEQRRIQEGQKQRENEQEEEYARSVIHSHNEEESMINVNMQQNMLPDMQMDQGH